MRVVRSDSAKLQDLIDTLSQTEMLSFRMRQEAAVEARKQVRRGFAENRDPYGAPWAPLKIRSGSPLNDTGRLAEFMVTLTPSGFILTSGTDYAATHQYGAVIEPKKGGLASRAWRSIKSALGFRVGTKYLTFSVDGQWFRLKRAVIPKRQMVPEGTWGDIWTEAFTQRFEAIVSEWAGQKGA